MQISLSNNITNLGTWDEQNHINIKLLNVFELMTILQNIYIQIVNNPKFITSKITFSEFCVINCVLETISSKLANKLFKSPIQNVQLKKIIEKISLISEWRPCDNPITEEAAANLSTSYNNNNNIFTYIEKSFFANKLFMDITEYCNNLLVARGHVLECPKMIGRIDHFDSLHYLHLYQRKVVSLTSTLHKDIGPEDLYQLLCLHSILFDNISHNNSVEAKAILAHTTQLCGSCLTLLAEYQEDVNIPQYINDKLINIIKYSYIVNSLKFITSEAINPLLDSWYRELKTFLYSYPGETFYNNIKNLEAVGMTLPLVGGIQKNNIEIEVNSLSFTMDHLIQEDKVEVDTSIIGQ